MNQLLTAAAISITLLTVGCSSDSKLLQQASTATETTTPAATTNLLTGSGFEAGSTAWEGNAFNALDDGSGSNMINYANVDTAGNPWDVNLMQVVAIEQGKIYELKFKVKSNGSRTIIAGIGINESPWTNNTETVSLTSDWETITLNLSAAGFGGENSRILFDMGAAAGEVLLDDVVLIEKEAVVNNGTFDSGLLINGDFTNGFDGWTGNAANPQDDGSGSNTLNYADVEVAGNPWDANLRQVVAIDQGKNYELKFKAKSNGDRKLIAGIGLNMEPWTSAEQAVDLTSEWQSFALRLSSAEFGDVNSRVLFDMGAQTGEVLIDDVSLMEVTGEAAFDDGLLTNGNFDQDNANWLAGVENPTDASTVITDDGNKIYFADVIDAGDAHTVNLSQKGIAIEEGKTYKLSFKAKSDTNRNILAGIGLSMDPWTNVNEEAALTSEWQDFEKTLTANFVSADGRVLFDMGDIVSKVYIDNVSLVLVSGNASE